MASTLQNASVGLSRLVKDQFASIRKAIGNARVVCIGEESHGTQEFYAFRAEITKALIEQEGFSVVLCESDFPTFYKLHRFVGGTHASIDTMASSSASSPSSSASASPLVSPRAQSPSAATPLLSAADTKSSPSYGTAHAETSRAEEEALATSVANSSQGAAQHPPRVTAEEVMEALKERFPVWMWRNEVVRDFVEWLQRENLQRDLHQHTPGDKPGASLPVALFGLDIYSMFTSTDQVIEYLDVVDPAMAERARKRYSVLQRFRPHEEQYCRAVLRGQVPPQHNPLKQMQKELHDKAKEFKNIFGDGDEYFNAQENARVVMAAEEYYRESYLGGGTQTWNIRDKAMVEMIADALAFHDEKLHEQGGKSRAIVWAHNSHIGDASATEQYERWGQVNVGHLVRKLLGKESCYLIGLSTAVGSVRAARRWNGRDRVMTLNPPLKDSTGDLFHQIALARKKEGQEPDFGVVFRRNTDVDDDEDALTERKATMAKEVMASPRLERFIGVQYIKQTERQSHYSQCRMSDQFDMVIHLDTTSALRPLPELAEPHLPTATTTTALTGQRRPGTVDYSKWDKILA